MQLASSRGFNKREVALQQMPLTARLIDRPIRPMFAELS